MQGLRDSYQRLRGQARALALDTGVTEAEFDAIFPELSAPEGRTAHGPGRTRTCELPIMRPRFRLCLAQFRRY